MIQKDTLIQIAESQKKELETVEIGIKRELLEQITTNIPHAIILSGIRRCGKSTLLRQLMKKVKQGAYFNFEDPRAVSFEATDIDRLQEALEQVYGKTEHYFFDEIQSAPNWERLIRGLLDRHKKCVVTGSNASLLSKDIGIKLTGRHLTYELFPFSYKEMLQFVGQQPSQETIKFYLDEGGFPEIHKYKKKEVLYELLTDILARDIIARYGLREAKILKELLLFLISNVGKEYSYNNLAKIFGLGSVTTVIAYISYFEESYLIFTIPKFDFSYKKQVISPKKVYCIDSGMINANTVSFSQDKGRLLENVIFIHLRKKYKDIYYFKEEYECDFLVKEKGKIIQAIQVCTELNDENREREMSGLSEAIKKFGLKTGTIITLNQDDKLADLKIVPAWKFLLED